MGINAIQFILSRICAHAGLSGKRTNHALKATAVTRMYEQGVDEQLIQERLGNSSEAVRSYKHTSSEQNVKISKILYGNNPKCHKLQMPKVKTVSKLLEEEIKSPESSQVVPSSTSTVTTVNYNYHGIDLSSAPTVNVYLIINIPEGIALNQPIVVNINIVLKKWKILVNRNKLWSAVRKKCKDTKKYPNSLSQ